MRKQERNQICDVTHIRDDPPEESGHIHSLWHVLVLGVRSFPFRGELQQDLRAQQIKAGGPRSFRLSSRPRGKSPVAMRSQEKDSTSTSGRLSMNTAMRKEEWESIWFYTKTAPEVERERLFSEIWRPRSL